LRKSIEILCANKGLRKAGGILYFPGNLFSNNKLHFMRYDGKKCYIKVVGERKFKGVQQGNFFFEKSRYHLSPDFKFFIDLFGSPVIRLRIGVFWTDLEGNPLDDKKSNRRRKALCKNWWNYEWLSRSIALWQWIREEHNEITILKTDSGDFRIGPKPISFSSDVGIDESSLHPVEEEDETQVLEENEEVDVDLPIDSV
jgi:hypothetical protein